MFDVYSMDLRGSREAVSLKSPLPSTIREYLEDISVVVEFILEKSKSQKVYLIGHSLGGALALIYASYHPSKVQGIVHMAGLYHYHFPFGPGFLLDKYREIRSYLPQWIPDPLSYLSHTFMNLLRKSKPYLDQSLIYCDSKTSYQLSKAIDFLRRLPIPLRSVVDFGIQFAKDYSISEKVIYRFFNYCIYPRPWRMYSIQNPLDLVDVVIESPTLGVLSSVFMIAIYDDLYHNHHRETAGFSHVINSTESHEEWPWWNEIKPGMDRFQVECCVPVIVAYANEDCVIRPKNTIHGFNKFKTSMRKIINYTKETIFHADSGIDMNSKDQIQDEISILSGNSNENSMTLPKGLSYGHLDILAGKESQEMWEIIVGWIEKDLSNDSHESAEH